jgi:hypothetical protein
MSGFHHIFSTEGESCRIRHDANATPAARRDDSVFS